MLECRRCVTQSKGHPGKFIEMKVANHEHGVLLQLWGHVDLPKSTLEIHGEEVCSSGHALQCFLYPEKGIQIFFVHALRHLNQHRIKGIHLSSVPILLHYTRGLDRSNSTSIQHISKWCMNLFQQRQRNAPKMFFEDSSSLRWISCSMALVHPSSLGLSTKMSQ